MSKKYVKPVILTVIFFVSVLVFSMLTNKVNKQTTTNMAEASLPVIQFLHEGKTMNELHGYVQKMDIQSMRDGLMPIGEERNLQLEILTYGSEVKNLSYKIRSIDGNRLIVEKKNADITVSKEKANCSISLPSLFEDNQEYHMEIALQVGDREIYYYTRITQAQNCYTSESLTFALEFHSQTFQDNAGAFIQSYMEPNTGNNRDLSYVDLSSSLTQVTWADFTGVKLTEPVVSFKEINESYNVIVLDYIMINVNDEKELEYYNIEEYYRLRHTPTRTYVLNFERRMNQIFRMENNFLFKNTGLSLGIRDNDIEYLSNDSGNYITFVQEGELFSYDRLNNTISKVFSFRGEEGMNTRENSKEHEINIIYVDEAGSISFIVYGYMNRGIHEGQVGVGAYYYDGISQTVEEEVFIPTNQSYEVLKAELGNLMYVNQQKMLYFMVNQKVYQIDMNSFTSSILLESDTDQCYSVSKSGRYLAWVDSKKLYSSKTIQLEDLKTGITYEVRSDKENYVIPIDFVGEDFVYGVFSASNVKKDFIEGEIIPMDKIEILNTSEEKQEVVKSYVPRSGKIGKVSVDESNIHIELVAVSGSQLELSGEDTIMNRDTETTNGVTLKKNITETKQTQWILQLKGTPKDTVVEKIIPKQILIEKPRTLELEIDNKGYFYVYARGKVLLATTDAGQAVRCANENYGIVVDENMKYIFKRARNHSQAAMTNLLINSADENASSLTKALSVVLAKEGVSVSVSDMIASGQSPIQIMKNALRDSTVLELKGCTIEDLLYFIDQGTLVFAKTGKDKAILLTGYQSNSISYYDTSTRQNKTISYQEAEKLFEAGGNYFIAYVK